MAMSNYLASNDLTDSPEAFYLESKHGPAGVLFLIHLLEGIARRDKSYWASGEGVLSKLKLTAKLRTDPIPIFEDLKSIKDDGFDYVILKDAIMYRWPAFTVHQAPYLNKVAGGDRGREAQRIAREDGKSGMPVASQSHASGNATGTSFPPSSLSNSLSNTPPTPSHGEQPAPSGGEGEGRSSDNPKLADGIFAYEVKMRVMPAAKALLGTLTNRQYRETADYLARVLQDEANAGRGEGAVDRVMAGIKDWEDWFDYKSPKFFIENFAAVMRGDKIGKKAPVKPASNSNGRGPPRPDPSPAQPLAYTRPALEPEREIYTPTEEERAELAKSPLGAILMGAIESRGKNHD